MLQPRTQEPIEQQIDQPLFPGVDIKRAVLSAKIAVQCDRRPGRKRFASERSVNVREIMKSGSRKVVQISLIGRSEQRFSPGKQRLGVDADCRFVKFGLAINIAPAQLSPRGETGCG